MIHSAEVKASVVQEASKLMSESLADSITIGDMRIDNKGNIQFKDNYNNWVTVDINKHNIEGLQYYDKKIKEYIDNRIDEKLADITKIKYKVISGED